MEPNIRDNKHANQDEMTFSKYGNFIKPEKQALHNFHISHIQIPI